MPRILIAGCGYIGQATAALFHEAGWEVEGWTASPESAGKLSEEPYPVSAVDISRLDHVAARAADFDNIIHCASSGGGGPDAYRAIYREGARNLLEVFAGTTLLFTSSTSVYAQSDGSWVTEASPAEPVRETSRILRETEELILAQGGIVARLAGIYGPGRCFLLEKFLAGEALIDRERDRFINQAHRDDIAAALFLLINRKHQGSERAHNCKPEIYNIVDDQPILQSECYEWLAAFLSRPLPPSGPSARERKRGDTNKRVSNAKLRAQGWNPRYPTFQDAIEKSILPSMSGRRLTRK
jgi:nucleoside-diphosphate-sugar epimerase